MNYFIQYKVSTGIIWNLNKFGFLMILSTLSFFNLSFSNKEAAVEKSITNIITEPSKLLSFNSDKLYRLYQLLPTDTKVDLESASWNGVTSYLFENDNISNRYKIIIKFNKYNEVTHLGLHIFRDTLTETYYSKVFEYIERELLAYLLLNNDNDIRERMNTTDVELLLNGNALNTKDLITSYLLFDKDIPFKLNNDSEKFIAIWKLDAANFITMQFPNDYTVITGKQKGEIENEILRDLKYVDSKFKTDSLKRKLSDNKDFDSIYVVHGFNYNESPSISSDCYYYISNPTILVYDTSNYKESLSNLLLNLIPTNIDLQIKHKLYGNKEEHYKINVNDFYDYFSSDYKFFFGWQTDTKEELKASVFIYNIPFAYIHLLIVETNIDELTTDNGTLNGTFYTFIRKNNLK